MSLRLPGGGSAGTPPTAYSLGALPTTGLPSGVLVQSIPRWAADLNNISIVASRLHGVIMELPGGVAISAATFLSGSQALVSGVAQWAGLYTISNGTMIRQSADDGAGAWAANSSKTFTFSTPYTPSAAEEVYVCLVAHASTAPNLIGVSTQSVMTDILPRYHVRTAGAITNLASGAGPITFDTAQNHVPYIRLS